MLSPSHNEFGCGYCRRKGGPAELKAFADYVLLEQAVNEAVRLQAAHPSAKQDRLLDLLSSDTSDAQGAGSTEGLPRNPSDEALISAVMQAGNMTREEALQALKLAGGL